MIVLILPDTSVEDELLRRARNQDNAALRDIYERYFTPVYQFMRLRLNDREQAKDLTADVFVDLFIAIKGRHPPRDSLRAWLFRVARNKLADHYGRQRRFPAATLEEWIPSNDEDPAIAFLGRWRLGRVRQALAQLNAEQQEVLILRFGQGLSLQETADVMVKSVSAIKSLQFRAVERLRDLLDAEE
jgi:RNA polymerase sigma-70 factor (ECF subfamily)